jgi:uncharacterized protein (TIGR00730 family)
MIFGIVIEQTGVRLMKQRSICLFCGSQKGNSQLYEDAANELGATIAQKNWKLIYGGGNVGLMGIAADACLKLGGQVIGVIPKQIMDLEVAHQKLTELYVVNSMHERKATMEKLSDTVVALPGGFGTLDELNEILTWRQLGYHQMPIYLLNINNYYSKFIEFIEHSAKEGFIKDEHLKYLIVCSNISELLRHWN